MCTGFVRRGKDVIVGFNMDINLGAVDYDVYAEPDAFYVGVHVGEPENMSAEERNLFEMNFKNRVLRIHGVNNQGHFGNCLNNLRFPKAPFKIGDDIVSIDQVVHRYLTNGLTLEDIMQLGMTKEIVNLPTNGVDIPDLAMHSLFADKEGRIMILEPGNGFGVITEKYAAMANFAVLELPKDLNEENAGYYGKDRYDKAMSILRESEDDFGVEDGIRLLREVKQEGHWATRVSFVYSNNENAVYYCLERDFDHMIRHQLVKSAD